MNITSTSEAHSPMCPLPDQIPSLPASITIILTFMLFISLLFFKHCYLMIHPYQYSLILPGFELFMNEIIQLCSMVFDLFLPVML